MNQRQHINSFATFLREMVRRGGPDPTDYDELDDCYHNIMNLIRRNELASADLPRLWPTLGEPFGTTQTMQGFGILKPHGYSGDFEMIDRIYQGWMSPDPRLVKWDRYFHCQKATQAVRNRKQYFLAFLDRICSKRPDAQIAVLSVGSGPARECFEYLAGQRGGGVTFHCVDQDPKAIEYARKLNQEFHEKVLFRQINAFRFTADSKYDWVWSAGLFDYLADDAFKFLARRLLSLVHPGGTLTIGNFSPSNPTRDLMEFGHWFLNYRDEDQLRALLNDDGMGIDPDLVCVDGEPEGINLFLHVSKVGGVTRPTKI